MKRTSRIVAALGVTMLGLFFWMYFQSGSGWWDYIVAPHFEYNRTPEQPIAFSHRVHFERGIPCAFCHMDTSRSTFAGIPSVLKCMGCHRVIIPQFRQIQILHTYWKEQKPIPWQRVTWVPDYVRFTHQPHITAGIACQTCHGPIGTMDRVTLHTRFRMQTCITCHRAMGARTDCFGACHH